ncbi:MAG: hypothetical protein D3923_05955, partial [Candidatus Electrothrix sp. AR3]|nr:hypothetical protein [Candidatus Electrothrix sp. AR3]
MSRIQKEAKKNLPARAKEQQLCGQDSGEDLEQDLRVILKVFDALSYYGVLFDRHGTIMTANQAFLDKVGLCKNDISGKYIKVLNPYISDIEDQFFHMQRCRSHIFHTQMLEKGGTMLCIKQTFVSIEEQGRELVIGIGQELDELNSSQEAALHKAEQQLKAANRLKRKFIANINHAIRTPMNAIIGYAEMLVESEL